MASKPVGCRHRVAACAALALWASSAIGQEAPRRPKIGLALGGGGARGAAHIGVLKVLEERRIPIDYIAGTSMGSVVGGLYAMGYSPAELEKLVATIDWANLFNDNPPRRQRSFRRKEDDFLYALGLEVGLKGGLTLPSGLVAGRKLGFLLESTTIPAAGVHDFGSLPIAFHAVAADVQTGEVVVLSKGSLPLAIRASMAIPVIFTPVEIDGRLLIDGGNAQNLPVQTVKDMGADIIIAVDVGSSGEIPKDKPSTATGILGRMMDIPLLQNTVASRKLATMVLTPDLKGIGTGDFARATETIPRGEAIARAHLADLDRWSVSEEEYRAWQALHRTPLAPPPQIAAITVAPVPGLDPRRVQHLVRSKPGAIDLPTLETDLQRLYGTGLFENVQFDLQGTGPSRELRITATPKSWGPTYLKVGLNLSSDLNTTATFGLVGLIDATEMNRLGGEWKTTVELGTRTDVTSQFYQPLGYSSYGFMVPRVSFTREPIDIFDNRANQRIATYRVRRLSGGLDLGYDFGAVAEVRGGVEFGDLKADLKTGQPEFPNLDVNTGAFVARVRVDQLDNPSIPKAGYFADVNFRAERESLGSEQDYEKLEVSAAGALTFGRLTTILRGRWGDPLGGNLPFYDSFTLGGLFNLSGYSRNQLFGRSLGLAEAIFYYQLSKGGAIIQSTYLGASVEAGNVWNTGEARTASSLHGAGSVFIAADTLLGPFYVAYGYSGSKHTSFYVLLARYF